MSTDVAALFEERLGRYQAAMALQPTDRVPIAPQVNYFAETYSGYTKQQIVYDADAALQVDLKFGRDFPAVDTLRSSRMWAPLYDSAAYRLFKMPGRDLAPDVQLQFVEDQYMKADEYRPLIDDPLAFMMDRFLPRALGELAEKGSTRSYMAFLKSGMAFAIHSASQMERTAQLQSQIGMPVPVMGKTLAPFDLLADGLRGLKGIMIDMRRQPDDVAEACDALVEIAVASALVGADPLKRYPIFIPTHKACFLPPKQFDAFYWPSFKRVMLLLIEHGYKIRPLLEGNWAPYWHHLLELPKASLLCDLDNECDVFKAKAEIGHHHCIAGGMPDSLLILGTTDQVRERVKLLCETVGRDGGFVINGGSGIPYTTRVENFRAMIDAVLEYGVYDRRIKPRPLTAAAGADPLGFVRRHTVTPWNVKRSELGDVPGDEDLIRKPWEMLEAMAFNWLWMWAQC